MAETAAVRALESRLALMHGRRHCRLTGTGSCGLFLALSGLEDGRRRVVFPATICLAPVYAAIYAGLDPVFADVRMEDGAIDPASVSQLLENDSSIGAVVAAHMYGNPASLDELAVCCARFGARLIEDAAPAVGGRDGQGRLFGAGGDLALLSFGHTKILDCGGGGAVLTDDDDWIGRMDRIATGLPGRIEGYDVLAGQYYRLYYAIWAEARRDRAFFSLYEPFPRLFRSLHQYNARTVDVPAIETGLDGLDAECVRRHELAARYRERLGVSEDIAFLGAPGVGVPWRCTFLVPAGRRNALLDAVRAGGYDASSWYPPAYWFLSGVGYPRPRAEELAARVVNLWVTSQYRDRIDPLCDLVLNVLREGDRA
ncbi:MAG: DegT/DnrJ/EryC1/StrS family aminotransferase [Pseudodesulfovibrio sp.]